MSASRRVLEPRVRACGHICVWTEGWVGHDYTSPADFDLRQPCCRCPHVHGKLGLYVHSGCISAERVGYVKN